MVAIVHEIVYLGANTITWGLRPGLKSGSRHSFGKYSFPLLLVVHCKPDWRAIIISSRNGSLSFSMSVRIRNVPSCFSFLAKTSIMERNELLLSTVVGTECSGRTIKKLSIDLSAIAGSNFSVSPQKAEAFWGSSSVNLDLALNTSFWSRPIPMKYSDQLFVAMACSISPLLMPISRLTRKYIFLAVAMVLLSCVEGLPSWKNWYIRLHRCLKMYGKYFIPSISLKILFSAKPAKNASVLSTASSLGRFSSS